MLASAKYKDGDDMGGSHSDEGGAALMESFKEALDAGDYEEAYEILCYAVESKAGGVNFLIKG
jgi:hypothetical protein